MTTNPDGAGLEPNDKDDAAAVARWYAAKLTHWRATKRTLDEAADAERAAHRDVDRAAECLVRALRGGSDLPESLPTIRVVP